MRVGGGMSTFDTHTREPLLTEILAQVRERAAADVRVALPAKVVRFDAATQMIDAQPMVREGYIDENGERQTDALPVIPNVPVCFPGSGPFCITFPIAVGDTVLLVFSDRSLDKWLSVGGVIDPGDDRNHHLTDAIAIPGLRPGNAALKSVGSCIKIGADAGAFEGVALGATLKTYLDSLTTALGSGSSGGGPVSWTTPLPAVPSVASGSVQVTP
jgi:hypothetical protein